MKKVLSIATPLGTYLTLASSAFGATINVCNSAGQWRVLCGFGFNSLGGLLATFITLLFVIAIIAALIYLILGGLKWLTSGGDKQAVTQAREHIIAAIIGLVIIFLSYFILNVLIGVFVPGASLSSITLPTL